jgi:hypothetical protein
MVAALGGLTGCSSGGAQDRVATVAQSFQAAWTGRDGPALCALLAPQTRSEVVQSAGQPCAKAVLSEDLPDASKVRSSRVWGRSAQVQLRSDTVFLAKFPGGWKVTAAGCAAQPEKPYDCQIAGG